MATPIDASLLTKGPPCAENVKHWNVKYLTLSNNLIYYNHLGSQHSR